MDFNENDRMSTNAMQFALNVCQSISAMTGDNFRMQADSLQHSNFSTPFPITVLIQFYGKITGDFIISLDDKTAQKLVGCEIDNNISEESLLCMQQESSGLLKEILNSAAGLSIVYLESMFGQLTHLPAIIVFGRIEFPPIIGTSVTIVCDDKIILCATSLNLAILKIGRKLEEAQNKLDEIVVSQKSMLILPQEIPQAKFNVLYKSLNEAGGDLYDVIKVSDDVFGYFVGDVSGHSISTGFIAAAMRALIKQNCVKYKDPLESMESINSILFDMLPDSQYITACYALLNRKLNTLSIINMGHPPVLIVPTNGNSFAVNGSGDVLGAFPKVQFEINEITVCKGDRFIIYTDGLLEAFLPAKQSTKTIVLGNIIDTIKHDGSRSLPEAIFATTYSKKIQTDDVVILSVDI